VVAAHTLRADELRVLEDACRECDLIDEMEAEQKGTAKTTRGSMGQIVAAPLVSELRQHRATLTNMLRSLALDKAPAVDAAAEARKAAEARQAELSEAQGRWVRRTGGAA
jgi:septal ring factor EnvC (AmiA/AmiB activator)